MSGIPKVFLSMHNYWCMVLMSTILPLTAVPCTSQELALEDIQGQCGL